MFERSLCGNREISCSTVGGNDSKRPASGRRGAEADDARAGEVRLLHISYEASEQTRECGSGVSGAKGGGQGKHGMVAHAPDTVPGKRDTATRPCAASCKEQEEGAVHRVDAPCRSRHAPYRVLLVKEECGGRSGWNDMDRV